MSINTFDEFQAAAVKTAIYPEETKVLYPALGLAGEAGEVANKVKKIIRDDDLVITNERQAQVAAEIGGVLWYCAALANDLQLNLGDIARENIVILASRQKRGMLKGDGDNR